MSRDTSWEREETVNTLNVGTVLALAQIMCPQGLFTRKSYYSFTTPWHVEVAKLRGTVLANWRPWAPSTCPERASFSAQPCRRRPHPAVFRVYPDGAVQVGTLFVGGVASARTSPLPVDSFQNVL